MRLAFFALNLCPEAPFSPTTVLPKQHTPTVQPQPFTESIQFCLAPVQLPLLTLLLLTLSDFPLCCSSDTASIWNNFPMPSKRFFEQKVAGSKPKSYSLALSPSPLASCHQLTKRPSGECLRRGEPEKNLHYVLLLGCGGKNSHKPGNLPPDASPVENTGTRGFSSISNSSPAGQRKGQKIGRVAECPALLTPSA